ncbi:MULTISPECIES: caspase, EACC1-associated type [unclassified Streptomyces]|uniref:caspase, EACC1-associated type n=1 Tax=unclassified Streptomyces TaxID=2593676 RepID=UPI002E2DD4A4|nr:caspase family protein [Streptomyces sp. NBC_00223]
MPPADPGASRAVLIGVSRYDAMPADRQLPAVARNLDALAALLTDPRVWGLPPEHCAVVREPADSEAVLAAIRAAARAVTGDGTLLVYYAGHGLTDPLKDGGGALHLALPGSYEPGGTHLALDYGHVRTALLREAAGVPRKVVVLDCCWSALAIPGAMGGAANGTVFANSAAIEGTAVLTACAATRQARSPEGETYTAFTGALVDLLEQGLPGGPETLDVGTVYARLTARLGGRGMPAPQLGCTGDGSGIPLVRNTAAGPSGEHERGCGEAEEPPARDAAAELRRRGDYDQASRTLRSAAAVGDRDSVRDLAAHLRRSGHYAYAAELELAPPATLPALITRLRTAGIV